MRKIFQSPRAAWLDPKSGGYQKLLATSDLFLCDQLIEKNILAKTGWKKAAKREFPFLVDTRIVCGHIDRETGKVW